LGRKREKMRGRERREERRGWIDERLSIYTIPT
jgi:hypothetical protein